MSSSKNNWLVDLNDISYYSPLFDDLSCKEKFQNVLQFALLLDSIYDPLQFLVAYV